MADGRGDGRRCALRSAGNEIIVATGIRAADSARASRSIAGGFSRATRRFISRRFRGRSRFSAAARSAWSSRRSFVQFGSDVTLDRDPAAHRADRRRRGVRRAREGVSRSAASSVRTSTGVVVGRGQRQGRDDRAQRGAGEQQSIVVDILLVAVGRGAGDRWARRRGREASTLDRGFIAVDDRYRTSVPGIAAIGDVISIGGRPSSTACAPRVGRRHSRRGADRGTRDVPLSTTTTCRRARSAIRKSAASV